LWSAWRLVVASIDLLTAVSAGFSFIYFARRFTAPRPMSPTRRVAVAVLSTISLATLVESVALLALALEPSAPAFANGSWALVRSLMLAGSLSMAVLVANRMAKR
jgi:hypothetical protein